jgi:hypothetical protein
LPGGRLLYSQNSFTKPNDVYVIRGLDQLNIQYDSWDREIEGFNAQRSFPVSQLTKFTEEELKGKYLDAGEEFYFEGAEKKIQGWILKPKGYSKDDKKKWVPLLLIHGGPQGVWEDGWSTRWNPNGRSFSSSRIDVGVVIQRPQCLLNRDTSSLLSTPPARPPLGKVFISRTLPQRRQTDSVWSSDLTDAIKEDWGGKPFVDLRKGWQYILDHYPQVWTLTSQTLSRA